MTVGTRFTLPVADVVPTVTTRSTRPTSRIRAQLGSRRRLTAAGILAVSTIWVMSSGWRHSGVSGFAASHRRVYRLAVNGLFYRAAAATMKAGAGRPARRFGPAPRSAAHRVPRPADPRRLDEVGRRAFGSVGIRVVVGRARAVPKSASTTRPRGHRCTLSGSVRPRDQAGDAGQRGVLTIRREFPSEAQTEHPRLAASDAA